MAVSIHELRQLLNYNRETGVFTWKVSLAPRGPVGAIAGTILKNGYRSIVVHGEQNYAHRLAWIFEHGSLPLQPIDHVNGNKDDNNIANLREASRSQNAANSKRRSDNTSGYKGVTPHRKRWMARIRKDGVVHRLGTYDTPELAHAAYAVAANKLFGDFARVA